jgi:hypothetical protein
MASATSGREIKSNSRLLLLFAIVVASVCSAGDVDEMQSVLQANFDACNSEDVDALIASVRWTSHREEFRMESAKLWGEKDIVLPAGTSSRSWR